jgi:hypothetical protein
MPAARAAAASRFSRLRRLQPSRHLYRKERTMKNRLSDLNNHLFAQIERLGDEDLTDEQIEREAKRGEAIVSVAEQIVKNADLQLKAATLLANHGYHFEPHLQQLAPDMERKAIANGSGVQ